MQFEDINFNSVCGGISIIIVCYRYYVQSVLYGLYTTKPEGYSSEAEGLYKP